MTSDLATPHSGFEEVSFNEKGDRSADYDLLNSITGGDNVERIGVINPNKAIVRLGASQ